MLRVYSQLLKDTIACVEDGHAPGRAANGAETPGCALYTRSEVQALQQLTPDALRAVHTMKKHFGGRYLGPTPRS